MFPPPPRCLKTETRKKTKGVEMKKLMMVLVMAFAAAMPLLADEETVGGYTWTYRINGETAEIYNYSSAISPSPTGSVTIPPTLGGATVTSIGSYAFRDRSGLTNVTIPDSVTSIGNYAFSGCSGLTSVTIPNSVTSIGSHAFYGCSGLTIVWIPNSVTSIGDSAFHNCGGLMSISVGSGNANYKSDNGLLLTKDGKTLIRGVNGDVTIPNSVTSIGDEAFYNCGGLTSVTIPNGVTRIGYSAFYGCRGLTSVTIPSSVTSIGDSAFSGCRGLTSVTIPDGVTSIGYEAFSGCNEALFDTTTIPGVKIVDGWVVGYIETLSGDLDLTGIRGIGYSAFYGCSGLTSVTIPDGVTSIGYEAFSGCRGLTSVTIPDSVTSIGDSAFYDCGRLTSVTIPDSVTNIGSQAFYSCIGLRSIKLPSGSFSLGLGAFNDTSAYYFAQLRPLVNADGVLGGSLISESPTGSASSGGSSSGGYALSDIVGDSTITSMTISSNTSIDSFLLADGQVFDMAIRIVNTAESAVRLSLPSGYDYETIGSADPLEIPASSTNMVTITRTAARTFLVSRQQLRTVR